MVIRVTPETKEQMDYLLHLEATSSIDFWSFSRSKDEPTDIRVSPETYVDHETRSQQLNTQHNELIVQINLKVQSRRSLAA